MIAPVAWQTLLAAEWTGALGRACWQGGLALALVGALCRLLPRLPGRVQCWLWRLAYLKLLVALVWAVPLDLPVLPATWRQAPVARRQAPYTHLVGTRRRQWLVDRRGARVRSLPGAADRSVLPGDSPMASTAGDWRLTTGACSPLLLLWLLGAVCSALRVRADWRRAQRLRRRGMAVRDEMLIAECRALCRRLGVRREPLLLTAAELDCPVLVGVSRPAVILPASFPTQFAPGLLCLMLAHELAHLKRRDLLWAWLPNLGRVLFFFHPLVWLAEAEWRLAQEMACDEQVVLSTGASRAGYGSMLLEVIGRSRSAVPAGLLSIASAESYGTVRRRLAAIGQIRAVSRQCRAWSSLVLAAAAIGGVIPWRLTAAPVRRPPPSREAPRAGSPAERPMARASFSSDERLVRILELEPRGSGPARDGSPSEPPRFPRPASQRQRLRAEAPGRSSARASRRDRLGREIAAQSLSEREGHSSLYGEAPVGIASQPREETKRGGPGASDITGDTPRTPRPVIVAELLPQRVQPAPASAARLKTLSPPFAALEMPDADLPHVSHSERKQADSAPDPTSGDLVSIALAQKMISLKRVRGVQILLVPNPLAGVSGLAGWKASPSFPGPKGVQVRVEGNGNPAELKRLIGEAVQNGALHPGAFQKMLSAATQEGKIDPRVLKKLLAAVDQADDIDPAPFTPQEWRLPEDKLLRQLDQQKRELEKQPTGGKPGGKPFVGIDPDF